MQSQVATSTNGPFLGFSTQLQSPKMTNSSGTYSDYNFQSSDRNREDYPGSQSNNHRSNNLLTQSNSQQHQFFKLNEVNTYQQQPNFYQAQTNTVQLNSWFPMENVVYSGEIVQRLPKPMMKLRSKQADQILMRSNSVYLNDYAQKQSMLETFLNEDNSYGSPETNNKSLHNSKQVSLHKPGSSKGGLSMFGAGPVKTLNTIKQSIAQNQKNEYQDPYLASQISQDARFTRNFNQKIQDQSSFRSQQSLPLLSLQQLRNQSSLQNVSKRIKVSEQHPQKICEDQIQSESDSSGISMNFPEDDQFHDAKNFSPVQEVKQIQDKIALDSSIIQNTQQENELAEKLKNFIKQKFEKKRQEQLELIKDQEIKKQQPTNYNKLIKEQQQKTDSKEQTFIKKQNNKPQPQQSQIKEIDLKPLEQKSINQVFLPKVELVDQESNKSIQNIKSPSQGSPKERLELNYQQLSNLPEMKYEEKQKMINLQINRNRSFDNQKSQQSYQKNQSKESPYIENNRFDNDIKQNLKQKYRSPDDRQKQADNKNSNPAVLYDQIYKTLLDNKDKERSFTDKMKEFFITPLKIYSINLFVKDKDQDKNENQSKNLSLPRISQKSYIQNLQRLSRVSSQQNNLVAKRSVNLAQQEERVIFQQSCHLELSKENNVALRKFIKVQIAVTQNFILIYQFNEIKLSLAKRPLIEIQRSNISQIQQGTNSLKTTNIKRYQCNAFKNLNKNSITINLKSKIDILNSELKMNKQINNLQEQCVSNFLLKKQQDQGTTNKIKECFQENTLISRVVISYEQPSQLQQFQEILKF
eukprot:403342561